MDMGALAAPFPGHFQPMICLQILKSELMKSPLKYIIIPEM